MLTRAALLVLLASRLACAAPFVLSQTVVDPAPAASDFFASSLASTGTRLVIGARFDDGAGTDAGAAWIYEDGVLDALTSPAPAAGAQFGFSVAAGGDWVAVGAPHASSDAAHAGAVYVFDAATRTSLATIAEPTPAFDDLFGWAVAAVGDALLVGAPDHDNGAGAAYLFDAHTGALLQTLANPTPADFDLFGASVAAVGTHALVGAPLDDTAATNAGAAYLFDATTGALVLTLTSPRARPGDSFGAAVAGVGADALVGAPFDGTVASNAGAAYLFDGTTGALLRAFTDPAGATDDRFGSALTALGTDVLVGAPFTDADAPDVGAAYVLSSATGTVLAQLDNPAPAAGDEFGAAVASLGSDVAVGAWLDDAAGVNAGALYVFHDVGGTTTTTTSTSTTSATTVPGSTTTTDTTTTDTSTTETTTTDTSSTDASSTDTTTTDTTMTDTTTTDTTTTDTTTTTLSEGGVVPGVCDDGDPCTTDVLDPVRGCTHAAEPGFDGTTCRLAGLAGLVRAVPTNVHGARRLVRRLAARVATTRRFVESARLDPSRGDRRLARALAALNRFTAAVRRGEQGGTVPRPLAEGMLGFAADVAARIVRLV